MGGGGAAWLTPINWLINKNKNKFHPTTHQHPHSNRYNPNGMAELIELNQEPGMILSKKVLSELLDISASWDLPGFIYPVLSILCTVYIREFLEGISKVGWNSCLEYGWSQAQAWLLWRSNITFLGDQPVQGHTRVLLNQTSFLQVFVSLGEAGYFESITYSTTLFTYS